MKAQVTISTGSNAVVKTLEDSPRILNCSVKGNFRIKGIRTTNPVAVGDIVEVQETGDDYNYITAIEPRRNYIIRRASNLSKESHIIAANLDRAMLIVTLAHPTTSTTFIDRFLATAEAYRVPVTIVINKIDLLDEDGRELQKAVEYLYNSIGYDTIAVSAKTGEGIDRLREMLIGHITLFSGNSGVGKTTLINDLIPGLGLRTGAISVIHDTGMHTTTFSEMFDIPGHPDSHIIDTPGVKGFGTIDFDVHEVAHYFPEIFETGRGCRYSNCTHTHEPGCAVREALEENRIAQSRFNSYLSILEDTTPDKYRKPY